MAITFLLFGATGVASVAYAAFIAVSFGIQKYVSQTEGLEVVYEDDRPEIDIVLVHGLEGHPKKTWTSRKLGKSVNWVTECLPHDIKDSDGKPKQIRVLSYGYSSSLFCGSQNPLPAKATDGRFLKYLPQALYLHSNRLIEQLADLRTDSAEHRRVIFIAHSLGGLIVKSALVHASVAIGEQDARLKAIELLTIGVLFFGTPQREMLWKTWSDLLGKMFKVAMLTPLDGIIQPLADQAEQLNLQIERYKSIESNFPNFSFFEVGKGRKDEPVSDLVVDAKVAVPQKVKKSTWEKIPIRRSHKDLVKFDSNQDDDYVKVVSRINQCLEVENYKRASDRHRKFFTPIIPSTPSDEDLVAAKDVISAHWPESRLNLTRVDMSDSRKDIETKQKMNKELLSKSERENGLSDQTTLKAVKFIADNSVEARDYEAAEALYKRLFVANQEMFSPKSAEAAAALKDVAEVAIRQGRPVEATKNLYHVREIQIGLGLKKDEDTMKVTEQIGFLCELRGLHDEALIEYSKTIDFFKATLGEFHDETLRVLEIEANIWRAKGKKDKAALVIAQAKEIETADIRERKMERAEEGQNAETAGKSANPDAFSQHGSLSPDLLLGRNGSNRRQRLEAFAKRPLLAHRPSK